ncbi:glycosyl hydrolase family 28-related protein [Sphingomonas sp. DG1-23]|uniref:rhamnogalacturonidase n=1 Tax=Sphingomonas sp. DG1-23 TaxID=3068316 RepID=UPI00273D564B|nr:glycosyl hydrolase family 28 protein [Sphingomonas sp. DG1-23]MDP5278943.1 glycosyl hydrolase family 28-related protein [Sphingomonas sp. DG1-23]
MGASPLLLANAEFGRRAVTLGLGAAFAAAALPVRASGTLRGFHDVRDHGAKGDGKTIDSPAINRAVMAAAKAGGGTVIVPPGRYLCFSIRLKDNITLVLSPGSVIVAADPDTHGRNYDLPEGAFEEQFTDFGVYHNHTSLIYGDGVSNVAIVGKGLIHGLGLEREGPGPRWHGMPGFRSPQSLGLTPEQARLTDPAEREQQGRGNKAVAFKESRNVLLRDFTILQGGHFAVYVLGCSNVTLDNLTVDTDRDGIDVDCCRNVRIAHCIVNAHKDDAICLKSSYALNRRIVCEDVTVIGCKTSGYALGSVLDGSYRKSDYVSTDKVGVLGRIKLGTDSVGGFRNVLVTDCICENSRGLQMGAIDGGTLEDVTFSNITMRNIVNHPLFVRLSARQRAPAGAPVATVRRVRFSDINVSGADGRYPCGIVGIEDKAIEDVTLADVHVRCSGGGTAEDAARVPPERRNSSLEPSFMGTLPAFGLYVRHARGIAAKEVSFTTGQPDARPAIVLDDVAGAQIDGVRTSAPVVRAVEATRSSEVQVGSVALVA